MQNKVLLNIRSSFNGEETLNLLCDGKISEKEGGYSISWEGASLSVEEENTVEVYGNDTFVFRLGKDNADLVLENGKSCFVADFDIGISQKAPVSFFMTGLVNTLDENGGKVILDYSISNPYTSAVSKHLEISVRK